MHWDRSVRGGTQTAQSHHDPAPFARLRVLRDPILMKITDVRYRRHDLRLAEPYTIAYETIDRATNLTLELHTADGRHVGYGCAAPDPEVTGEDGDAVEAVLREVIEPYLRGAEAFAYARIIRDLRDDGRVGPSALCMVDAALHDLIARYAELPLFELLGGFRREIPTSVTVGILPPDETLERVREWRRRGFNIVKIKGGASLQGDLERLTLIRELYPELRLRFDGNQGYTEGQAIEFATRARGLAIEIFEQPIAVRNEAGLGEVTDATRLRVMADESLKTLGDAFRLAQHERVDMVNIKLQKVGGLIEGIAIDAVGRAAGLEAMVGCLDECSLGIAAGLHFALGRPNVLYADLDGHLDLVHDPYAGLFTIVDGVMRPGGGYGVGVVK